MNSSRYKTLLSYLPGMAAIVNSFQSEQVQLAVFDRLITALEEKNDSIKVSAGTATEKDKAIPESSSELEHDILEGDSIHAVPDSDE